MKRRILACILAVLCLVGCSSDPVGRAVDHKDLRLILPADFLDLSGESYAEGADFLYGRNTLVLKGMAESKSVLTKMTLQEYTDHMIRANKLDCTPKALGDGFLFVYEAPVGESVYTYTTATYEGPENFWVLQFYCPKDTLEENQPEIDVILGGLQAK